MEPNGIQDVFVAYAKLRLNEIRTGNAVPQLLGMQLCFIRGKIPRQHQTFLLLKRHFLADVMQQSGKIGLLLICTVALCELLGCTRHIARMLEAFLCQVLFQKRDLILHLILHDFHFPRTNSSSLYIVLFFQANSKDNFVFPGSFPGFLWKIL